MLTKNILVDKIEIVEIGIVQVRTATQILEDGNIISQAYHRHTVAPGENYANEDARVQAICAALHTPEVIAKYIATQVANSKFANT